MPPRVRFAIARQQDESERLIGWIQLLIVIILATLIGMGSGDGGGGSGFQPAMAVLMAAALATATRLVLAHRGRLSQAFLMIAETVDILLLILLIWSLHLHYHQPTVASLKTPMWGYVFIFIALRALRLEPRYVVLAGSAAILGWTALVVVAILGTPGSIVTDDLGAYAYSARIMIGAEIDKLVSIALVTIILALALTRGRRLLVEAATGNAAARDLARFFSPSTVRRITEADQPLLPGHGEVCEAAVLYVDIKRFTRLASKLSADRTLRLLTAYQARVVPIVRAHGGTIDKFLGDGIMVVFMADAHGSGHARHALEASLAVAEAMAGWCPADNSDSPETVAVDVSIGIAHGQVVIGAVGAPDRLEYTVIGHPVNLATKLEKHTRLEPATVIAAGSTFDLAILQGFEAPPGALRRPARISGLDGAVEIAILAPESGYSRTTITEHSACCTTF